MGIGAQLVLLIFAVFAIWVIKVFILRPREFISYYTKQGVTLLKGADRLLLGNIPDFIDYDTAGKATTYKMESPFNWVIKKTLSEDGQTYDSSKHKACIMTLFAEPIVLLTCPEIVSELYTTKNSMVDKTGIFLQAYEDVAPTAFLFEPAKENWQKKRKAVTHAFYKDRFEKLMNVLKEKLNTWVDERNKEIENSPDGKTVVDIATSF